MILAAVLIVVAACGPFPELQVNSYDTLEDAQSDRLFERGWVPDVLPRGAGPIVESHDVDSNARCSKSGLPPDALADVSEALVDLGFRPSSRPPKPLPLANCPFDLDEAMSSGASLLVAPGQHAVVTGDELYFWSHH